MVPGVPGREELRGHPTGSDPRRWTAGAFLHGCVCPGVEKTQVPEGRGGQERDVPMAMAAVTGTPPGAERWVVETPCPEQALSWRPSGCSAQQL